ncbi:hypothetical protein ACLBXP_06280, partial [Methylobacterium sp. A54F]
MFEAKTDAEAGSGAAVSPDDRLIVIVDRRPLVGQCLLASLRDADAQMRFETFASLGQWHQDTS